MRVNSLCHDEKKENRGVRGFSNKCAPSVGPQRQWIDIVRGAPKKSDRSMRPQSLVSLFISFQRTDETIEDVSWDRLAGTGLLMTRRRHVPLPVPQALLKLREDNLDVQDIVELKSEIKYGLASIYTLPRVMGVVVPSRH